MKDKEIIQEIIKYKEFFKDELTGTSNKNYPGVIKEFFETIKQIGPQKFLKILDEDKNIEKNLLSDKTYVPFIKSSYSVWINAADPNKYNEYLRQNILKDKEQFEQSQQIKMREDAQKREFSEKITELSELVAKLDQKEPIKAVGERLINRLKECLEKGITPELNESIKNDVGKINLVSGIGASITFSKPATPKAEIAYKVNDLIGKLDKLPRQQAKPTFGGKTTG